MSTAALLEEEVLEEVSSLGEEQKKQIRLAAESDLYFICKGVLNYRDMTPRAHGAFCRFIQDHDAQRRLAMMPRVHLKSTIATIGDNVRLGLADPEEYRGLIIGETATTGRKFLEEIKGHIEKNEMVRVLWPHAVPKRFTGPGTRWTQDMACLNRSTVYKEWTWTALGVGGAAVSGHWTRIKCDDLIGLEAYKSTAVMESVKIFIDAIEPLLVDQNTDIIDFIGTRWSVADVYGYIIEIYGERLAVFTREAIENNEIIFPQKHNWAEYKQLMEKSPAVWYAQYCNNPVPEGRGDLPVQSIRNYQLNADATEVKFRDPISGHWKTWKVSELDRVLCADPNSGSKVAPDTAAVVVVGVSPDDEVFVLHSWSGRVSPSEFVDVIYDRAKRWQVRTVGIEKAGQQNTQHYFEKKVNEDGGPSFRIEPLKPKSRDKDYRIRNALEPVIRSGRLYMLAAQQVLRKQLMLFPDYLVIDEADALAYFVEIARRPFTREEVEERGKVINLMTAKRNRRTGY